MLSRPQALAFDLDGTLIDSRLDIADACNRALTQWGREALPDATIASFVGDGVRALLARAFHLSKESPELDGPLETFLAHYEQHPVARTTFLRYARELLRIDWGIPMALITNKSRRVTIPILDALGIRDCFAFVYAGGDGPLKPDGHGLVCCAAQFGISATSLWLIGDGPQDVGAARAVGACSVFVKGGFHEPIAMGPHQADVIVSSLEDLPALLHAAGVKSLGSGPDA